MDWKKWHRIKILIKENFIDIIIFAEIRNQFHAPYCFIVFFSIFHLKNGFEIKKDLCEGTFLNYEWNLIFCWIPLFSVYIILSFRTLIRQCNKHHHYHLPGIIPTKKIPSTPEITIYGFAPKPIVDLFYKKFNNHNEWIQITWNCGIVRRERRKKQIIKKAKIVWGFDLICWFIFIQ